MSRATLITAGDGLSVQDPHGIVLGKGLAANLGVSVGDTVVLLANTPSGGISAVEGHVRGLFTTVTKNYGDSALRVPIRMARDLLRASGSHVWIVMLDETRPTEAVLAALQNGLPKDSIEVVPWFQVADFYNKTVSLMSRQINVVKLIISIIIILCISNTLMMSIMERTSEIGTSLALGVRRRRILRLFIGEGALIGVIGGAIGVAAGVALALIISAIGIPMPPPPGMDQGYTGEIMVTWKTVVEAVSIAFSTTLLASVYPAWKASRMDIVDALRYNR